MTANLFSVEDRVVIVTGGAAGNGRAIAEGFLSHGAKVVVVDIKDIDYTAASSFNSKQALILKADLRKADEVQALVDKTLSHFGRIDALVNNAGVSLASADPYDFKIIEQTWDVNFKAAYALSRACVEAMKANNRGSIINITSLGAELGFANNPAYQTSKAALRQLTKAMAYDFAAFNIRVNNVCPGYIHTAMTDGSYRDPKKNAERQNRMILKRWGKSEDLAGPCIFLASDASCYISGTDIYVDGGWTAKGL